MSASPSIRKLTCSANVSDGSEAEAKPLKKVAKPRAKPAPKKPVVEAKPIEPASDSDDGEFWITWAPLTR